MHISKLLPAICALAVCANVVSIRAQDNPAQAAARAALLEKMSELDAAAAQPPAIVVTPSGATVEKPATTAIQTPEPAPTLPVMAATNNVETQTQSDAQKAALLAQEKKAAAAQQAAQARQEAAMAKKQKAEDEAVAKAKAQQAAEAQKAAASTAKPSSLGFQPIQAPPPPVSAAKQEQLQVLLVKYQADQVSSAEYQTQRAAILAQP